MNLLVVGATGGTGVELVRQALDRGHRVAAFVRDPSRLGVSHERLESVVGDILDPASIVRALRGRDAVISALGHKTFFRPSRILSAGTANLVAAMEKLGIKRFLCITTLGIAESSGRLGLYYSFFVTPFITSFYFRDKERQELIVRASHLDWTIIRPGRLTGGKINPNPRTGEEVGSYVRTQSVSRATVAAFILNELTERRHLRKAVGVIQ